MKAIIVHPLKKSPPRALWEEVMRSTDADFHQTVSVAVPGGELNHGQSRWWDQKLAELDLAQPDLSLVIVHTHLGNVVAIFAGALWKIHRDTEVRLKLYAYDFIIGDY